MIGNWHSVRILVCTRCDEDWEWKKSGMFLINSFGKPLVGARDGVREWRWHKGTVCPKMGGISANLSSFSCCSLSQKILSVPSAPTLCKSGVSADWVSRRLWRTENLQDHRSQVHREPETGTCLEPREEGQRLGGTGLTWDDLFSDRSTSHKVTPLQHCSL